MEDYIILLAIPFLIYYVYDITKIFIHCFRSVKINIMTKKYINKFTDEGIKESYKNLSSEVLFNKYLEFIKSKKYNIEDLSQVSAHYCMIEEEISSRGIDFVSVMDSMLIAEGISTDKL